MLGWFKKKFGKKDEDSDQSVVSEEVLEEESATEEVEEVEEVKEVKTEPLVVLDDLVSDEQEEEQERSFEAPVEPALEKQETSKEYEEPIIPDDSADLEPEPLETPVEPQEPADLKEPEAPESKEQELEVSASSSESEIEIDAEESEEPEVLIEPEQPAEEESLEDTEEEREAKESQQDHASEQEKTDRSFVQRLQQRLGKTRDALVYRLDHLFLGRKEIDQELYDELEEILITADLGVATTMDLLEKTRKRVKRDELSDPKSLKAILQEQMLAYIESSEQPAELVMPEEGPFVIMVVGVNGVGKTTSIGKIAAKFVHTGQSVLLVAGDTFRAAAIDQLKIWGERVGVEVIAQTPGADPSSVVFDGMEYGRAHEFDVILVDTAGRLHTSVNLMEELKKIKRVMSKKMEGAPHEVMLVLDATTGQNGLSQAKLFHEAVGVTGLTLTKLDGTAKGGIVANICREMNIPVRFIGIGEQVDDLRDFDSREFVDALFASSSSD